MGDVDLGALFDEIISKTERREGLSDVKEAILGFSPIEDMKDLREEFLAAEKEIDLYYALIKLSNARGASHLWVRGHEQGPRVPERSPCATRPVRILPDLPDIHSPTFFVAEVSEGLRSPQAGDIIVGVNGSPADEYVEELTPG